MVKLLGRHSASAPFVAVKTYESNEMYLSIGLYNEHTL